MQLKRIEEWLSTKEPVIRKKLSTAILSAVGVAVPIALALSGLSTVNKIAGSAAWVLLLLCLWLLSWMCIYRTKVRRLEAELSKTPELPTLDGLDNSMLIYLVTQNLGCGVDRIAVYAGKASYEIAHSMDKLEAHGYVQKTRKFTASGAEYKATPKGRDKCVNPQKYA